MHPTVPFWPFAILAILIAAGYRQSQERVVKPGLLIGVAAAMLGLSIYGVTAAFGAGLVPVVAWALGYAASVRFSGPWVAPRGMTHEGGAVRVPGSWVPMGLMMGIFMSKFALGFLTGVGAHVVHELWFAATASALFGALSGGFAARAIAVRRFAGSAPRTGFAQPATATGV